MKKPGEPRVGAGVRMSEETLGRMRLNAILSEKGLRIPPEAFKTPVFQDGKFLVGAADTHSARRAKEYVEERIPGCNVEVLSGDSPGIRVQLQL